MEGKTEDQWTARREQTCESSLPSPMREKCWGETGTTGEREERERHFRINNLPTQRKGLPQTWRKQTTIITPKKITRKLWERKGRILTLSPPMGEGLRCDIALPYIMFRKGGKKERENEIRWKKKERRDLELQREGQPWGEKSPLKKKKRKREEESPCGVTRPREFWETIPRGGREDETCEGTRETKTETREKRRSSWVHCRGREGSSWETCDLPSGLKECQCEKRIISSPIHRIQKYQRSQEIKEPSEEAEREEWRRAICEMKQMRECRSEVCWNNSFLLSSSTTSLFSRERKGEHSWQMRKSESFSLSFSSSPEGGRRPRSTSREFITLSLKER